MSTSATLVPLDQTDAVDRAVLGGKAAELARMRGAGLDVPAGFVVTAAAAGEPDLDRRLRAAAAELTGDRFAVRSSAVAEDLPDASYAGLYETYLDVPEEELAAAVRRCFGAAASPRVTAYRERRGGAPAGMAVLVQPMIDAVAAGVAFSAHPVTGDRDQTVVTAVAGLGEPLVSGEAVGEEWTIQEGSQMQRTRPGEGDEVLTAEQAARVGALAEQVAAVRDGIPQDIEWAIDHAGKLWLLQARPMTAVPDPVSWGPPGPGLWMRNFRLGEWLPEAVTPLFATWLLPVLEAGYLDGMQQSLGIRVPFRYAVVNGWYYNATPTPSVGLLGRVLRGRSRAVKVLFNALVRVSTNPAAADREVLSGLEHRWRGTRLPRYQSLVARTSPEVAAAAPMRLVAIVNELGREAGIALWYLAVVGGSAWKMEAALTKFARRHLASALPVQEGGAQVLVRGLPGMRPSFAGHAVHSVDWFHPTAGELTPQTDSSGDRHEAVAEQRRAAELGCRAALGDRPHLAAEFSQLLDVNQRYAVTREQQAAQFTLAWPVLRACANRLGQLLVSRSLIERPADVFFLTLDELTTALEQDVGGPFSDVARRREEWQRQRRLAAPLTLGRPPRLIGDVIDNAARRARGTLDLRAATLVGHPASAGRAVGPVRVVDGPDDFGSFADGDVLVARATSPVWTPLFGHAAAVVTDGGTLAAHASLVAREYGIPAVVGTGDATRRLRTGQVVTVDGTAGTVTLQTGP